MGDGGVDVGDGVGDGDDGVGSVGGDGVVVTCH